MTVGVAAISQVDNENPTVLLGADRLLTTRQVSQIEHEHSESKLSELGAKLPAANIACVLSGSLSLGEELKTRINHRIATESQEYNPSGIGVEQVAQWAAEEYRGLIHADSPLSNFVFPKFPPSCRASVLGVPRLTHLFLSAYESLKHSKP